MSRCCSQANSAPADHHSRSTAPTYPDSFSSKTKTYTTAIFFISNNLYYSTHAHACIEVHDVSHITIGFHTKPTVIEMHHYRFHYKTDNDGHHHYRFCFKTDSDVSALL